jgi:hypothetical protein
VDDQAGIGGIDVFGCLYDPGEVLEDRRYPPAAGVGVKAALDGTGAIVELDDPRLAHRLFQGGHR